MTGVAAAAEAWGTVSIVAVVGGSAGWALASLVDQRHPITQRLERPALAAATAALCALMATQFDSLVSIIALCVLCAGLVVLAAIDLHTRRLPREISYSTLAIGVPLLVAAALIDDSPERIVTMVAGAVLALGWMLVLYGASRGGMGDGDVRLAPLLGAYLGWMSLAHVPVGLFLGFLFGAAVGVVAMIAGSSGRRTTIAFGPFLAAGTIVAIVAGQQIIGALWGL